MRQRRAKTCNKNKTIAVIYAKKEANDKEDGIIWIDVYRFSARTDSGVASILKRFNSFAVQNSSKLKNPCHPIKNW